MNELFFNFLFFIEQSSGNQIFFDKNENKFVQKKGEVYTTLFDDDSIILGVEAELLLPLSSLDIDSIEIKRLLGNKGSQFSGQKYAKSVHGLEQKYANTSNELSDRQELIRKYVGKKPIIIYAFADDSQTDDIHKVCTILENLIVSTLKNVKDGRSIKKTKKVYDDILKYQSKNDLYKLCEIQEKLEQKKVGQKNIKNSKEKHIENIKRKRKIKIVLFFTIVVSLFVSYLMFFKKSATTIVEKKQQFNYDSLLQVYQYQNNVKFWQWRTDTITTTLKLNSYNSEIEVLQAIKEINDKIK